MLSKLFHSSLKQLAFSPLRRQTTITKSSFVVYVYVDYNKEIGTRVLRTYLDRQKAIDFAESLSTKYYPASRKEEEEEEYKSDNVMVSGNEFDAWLCFPKDRLTEFGLSETDVEDLWYLRVAVDKAQHFDE
jgi:hypothetical protein